MEREERKFTMHNNWLVWENMSELQWGDLNDSLSFSSFLFELCNLVKSDALDSFCSQDIHLYSLISPQIPLYKMPLQDFSLHFFFILSIDHTKRLSN